MLCTSTALGDLFVRDLRYRFSKPCFQLRPKRLEPFGAQIENVRLKFGIHASLPLPKRRAIKGNQDIQLIYREGSGIECRQLFKPGCRVVFRRRVRSLYRIGGTACSIRQTNRLGVPPALPGWQ